MGTAVWIVLWIVSGGVGFWLFQQAGPAIPGISEQTEMMRKGILISALIPFFAVNLLGTFALYALYKSRSASESAIVGKLHAATLQAPPPPPALGQGQSSDNPFL